MDDRLTYLRDGVAIYQRSFAIIRAEADLTRFSPEEADVVVRMIHACGLVEAARNIVFGGGLVAAARNALAAGAPILCDAEMVAHGITRARLPAGNDVICTLHDPQVPALAQTLGTTRTAAAIDLWGEKLSGAPILCAAKMVAHGITRARLPAGNDVICTLHDPQVPALAQTLGTTRTAAAIDLWGEKLSGAVVAIGNAPTALFRL